MTNHDLIERAAEAAYTAHHRGIDDIAWKDMPDWMKESWRYAARAVIETVQAQLQREAA
ncbi:MAG: hypothetical protein ACR2OE_17900 [Thermomicrobiales bacterium]